MTGKIAPCALLAVLLGCGSAAAQSRGFGLGLIVGEPTGLSAKLWQTRSTALDFAAAWSFADATAFHLHGDILVHRFDLIRVEQGALPVYYGLGARVRFANDEPGGSDEDVRVGIRFPVGLDYLFESAPFDVFLEIVPILDLAPDTDVSLNASLGLRYWFR